MYIPTFSINTAIFNQSIAIAEKVGLLKEANVFKDMHLRKANRVKSIYASCAIENNSLSLDEVMTILSGKTVIGPLNDIIEIQNAASAYEHFESYQPFCIDDFLRAHSYMTHHAISESGQFRTKGVGILKGGQIVHQGAPSHCVPQLMRDLFDWASQSDIHLLLKSCIVHYEIENIHPFADGNGRMGRLWQSIILAHYDELFRFIPIESLVYEHQQDYYDALQKSHECGHCNAFVEFMLSVIAKTLDEVFVQWNAEGRPLRNRKIESGLKTDESGLKTDESGLKTDESRLKTDESGLKTDESGLKTDESGLKTTKTAQAIYQLISEQPEITLNQIGEKLGVGRSCVAKHIHDLKAKGFIERIGSDRKGYWKIVPS